MIELESSALFISIGIKSYLLPFVVYESVTQNLAAALGTLVSAEQMPTYVFFANQSAFGTLVLVECAECKETFGLYLFAHTASEITFCHTLLLFIRLLYDKVFGFPF